MKKNFYFELHIIIDEEKSRYGEIFGEESKTYFDMVDRVYNCITNCKKINRGTRKEVAKKIKSIQIENYNNDERNKTIIELFDNRKQIVLVSVRIEEC